MINCCIVLQAFSVVFEKAIDRAEPAEEVKQRVLNLIDCITYSVFTYTARGLFERDKIIFTSQMTFLVGPRVHSCVDNEDHKIVKGTDMCSILKSHCCILQILMAANDINPVELDFLLRFPAVPNVTSPVDFMNNNSWGGIKVILKKY